MLKSKQKIVFPIVSRTIRQRIYCSERNVFILYESDLDIFISPPTLSTERLLLRKLAVSDYKDMYEYSKLPETSRYLLWSPHETPRFTKKYLSYLQGEYRGGRFYDFAVVEKKSGKMIASFRIS